VLSHFVKSGIVNQYGGSPQVEDEYLSEEDFVGGGIQAIREYWSTLGLEPPSHQR
jgi:hypothetical protein